ncbi:hypothetical protein [Haloarchaeobius sp. TZWWS8]
MLSLVGDLYQTFGPFVIPATLFALGIVFYAILVYLNQIRL